MTATPTERGSPLLAGRGAGALRARWRCVARSMRLPRAVIGIMVREWWLWGEIRAGRRLRHDPHPQLGLQRPNVTETRTDTCLRTFAWLRYSLAVRADSAAVSAV